MKPSPASGKRNFFSHKCQHISIKKQKANVLMVRDLRIYRVTSLMALSRWSSITRLSFLKRDTGDQQNDSHENWAISSKWRRSSVIWKEKTCTSTGYISHSLSLIDLRANWTWKKRKVRSFEKISRLQRLPNLEVAPFCVEAEGASDASTQSTLWSERLPNHSLRIFIIFLVTPELHYNTYGVEKTFPAEKSREPGCTQTERKFVIITGPSERK